MEHEYRGDDLVEYIKSEINMDVDPLNRFQFSLVEHCSEYYNYS